jgi:hypothetical protein
MPYYVYAIHPGSRINRLCGSFADYQEAETCEREYQPSKNSEGDHFVVMIYAENKAHALQRIKQIPRKGG